MPRLICALSIVLQQLSLRFPEPAETFKQDVAYLRDHLPEKGWLSSAAFAPQQEWATQAPGRTATGGQFFLAGRLLARALSQPIAEQHPSRQPQRDDPGRLSATTERSQMLRVEIMNPTLKVHLISPATGRCPRAPRTQTTSPREFAAAGIRMSLMLGTVGAGGWRKSPTAPQRFPRMI